MPVERDAQLETFGGGNEVVGRQPLAGLRIAHAQQHFEMAAFQWLRARAGHRRVQRRDRLAIDLEQVAVDRLADAQGPAHGLGALVHLARLQAGQHHPVAAQFLGGEAGGVGQREQAGVFDFARLERDQADAHGDVEHVVLPADPVVFHGALQVLQAQLHGVGIAGQQQGELVAADPEHLVAGAQSRLEQRADAVDQRVAGGVAGGVVDQREVVQVQVGQRAAFALPGQRPLHGFLERRAIGQVGGRIGGGAPQHLARGHALLVDRGHQHQRHGCDQAHEAQQQGRIERIGRRPEAGQAKPGQRGQEQDGDGHSRRGPQRLEAQRAPHQQGHRQGHQSQREGAVLLAAQVDGGIGKHQQRRPTRFFHCWRSSRRLRAGRDCSRPARSPAAT